MLFVNRLRRSSRAQSSAWLATLIALAPSIARADETPGKIDVAWNAPPECTSKDDLLGDIRKNLGGPTRHSLDATVDVTRIGPDAWTAKLATNVDGTPGERTLHASTCDSLERATAFILALTVDPERVAKLTSAPATAPRPKPESATPPSSEGFRVVAAASAVGETATLPNLGLGIEGSLGLLAGPLRIEGSFRDFWAQHPHATLTEGTDIHVFDFGARGCFRGRLAEPFEIDPCAVGRIVFASSDGFGEDQPFERATQWGNVGAELLAAWAPTRVIALRWSVGADVPLARPPFVLLAPQGEIQLHRPAAVSGNASLGIEARFP